MPSPEQGAQMDLKLPWVQSWEIPGGLAIFNHLTAALKLELGSWSLWRLVGGDAVGRQNGFLGIFGELATQEEFTLLLIAKL